MSSFEYINGFLRCGRNCVKEFRREYFWLFCKIPKANLHSTVHSTRKIKQSIQKNLLATSIMAVVFLMSNGPFVVVWVVDYLLSFLGKHEIGKSMRVSLPIFVKILESLLKYKNRPLSVTLT